MKGSDIDAEIANVFIQIKKYISKFKETFK